MASQNRNYPLVLKDIELKDARLKDAVLKDTAARNGLRNLKYLRYLAYGGHLNSNVVAPIRTGTRAGRTTGEVIRR